MNNLANLLVIYFFFYYISYNRLSPEGADYASSRTPAQLGPIYP